MRGIGGALIINMILVICFFVPGTIHALWITLSNKKIGK